MTIDINGMAHVILTVSRFEVAREFYRKLLPEFGMKPVFDGDKLFYCVGARTAIGIEPCDPALAGESFVQLRGGLHHLCLRARSREDVDRCGALLKEMNATIVRGPQEGSWAPGYYSVLFEDPDGIRLEVNFVPGAGLLAEGARFDPEDGYAGEGGGGRGGVGGGVGRRGGGGARGVSVFERGGRVRPPAGGGGAGGGAPVAPS